METKPIYIVASNYTTIVKGVTTTTRHLTMFTSKKQANAYMAENRQCVHDTSTSTMTADNGRDFFAFTDVLPDCTERFTQGKFYMFSHPKGIAVDVENVFKSF